MRFTVLTPTFNRAHTLERVYKSLCAQTLRDFEWVVVDDGSTDQTADLVASWNSIPIRYFRKSNGGKHTAVNLGVREAKGEFVVIFDSDDRCTSNALERFDFHWRQLPDPSAFANLWCLCQTPDGNIIGESYNDHFVDAFGFSSHMKYRNRELWGMHRRDVLHEYPFPEGERFVPEGLVWNRIAHWYAARFFNEPLRIYEPPGGDSLTAKQFRLRAASPKATLTFYWELATSSAPPKMRMRAGLNFCRFAAVAALNTFEKCPQD